MEPSPSLRDLFDQPCIWRRNCAPIFSPNTAPTRYCARDVEGLLVADAADDAALIAGGAEAAVARSASEAMQALPPGSRIGSFDSVGRYSAKAARRPCSAPLASMQACARK